MDPGGACDGGDGFLSSHISALFDSSSEVWKELRNAEKEGGGYGGWVRWLSVKKVPRQSSLYVLEEAKHACISKVPSAWSTSQVILNVGCKIKTHPRV